MIDLNDYYSGGYFLLRADKPDWSTLQSDLLPEKLVSLSTCMCPRVSVGWGWNPGDKQAALDFGIPKDKLDEFVDWCGYASETEIGVWSMFSSLDNARQFIRRFLPDATDLKLIGVGLRQDLAEKNWLHSEGQRDEGVEKRIQQQLPIELGGEILGFDVVMYNYNDFGDSWLCSDLQHEMHNLFAIRPNQYGLLNNAVDARKIYEWIDEGEMLGIHRAEPEPYDFWLLLSYPLQIPSP
jgi:hypothetical protein